MVLAGLFVSWLMERLEQPMKPVKPQIQVVDITRPPPPPPKEEEPPPPEIEEEEIDMPEPEPLPDLADAPDEAPPGEQLGLDADGVAGSDGFGLVANRGGRGIIGSGNGSAFRYYARQLQDELVSQLSSEKDIRKKRYSVDIKLWLDPDGSISRVALSTTTGDAELDDRLADALGRLEAMASSPPAGMPQPIRLRIVSRT